MKIAYLSTFYPLRGGIAQFNSALYREFEKTCDVKAFTFSRQYPNLLFPGKSQYVSENDPAVQIDSLEILDTINPISYIKTANAIRRYSPDLLVMKFWMPFFAPSLGWVARSLRKSNTKIITIIDNAIPHEKRIGDIPLTKFFFRQNHGFIVMSNTVKNDLISIQPDAKYKFIEHPLYSHFGEKIPQSKAREMLNIPANKKVLLFFGFIRKYKGLDVLLETMNLLREDYHLIIAGEVYGSFNEEQAIIAKYNLGERISLNTRYISDDEVPAIFSASDVCILPYKSATQSGIMGIAEHFDLPMIATNTGSLKEAIDASNSGLVIEKADPQMLKSAITEYFDNNLYKKYSESIQLIKQRKTFPFFAQELLSFYSELL